LFPSVLVILRFGNAGGVLGDMSAIFKGALDKLQLVSDLFKDAEALLDCFVFETGRADGTAFCLEKDL